jgi:hypothetical protein
MVIRTYLLFLPIFTKSRDSIVGIATVYALEERWVGVRVPVGLRIFSSPRCPDRFWGPLTSNYCRDQENVDIYIHSPIYLHGVVLNYLSTGTTLPYLNFYPYLLLDRLLFCQVVFLYSYFVI